MSFALLLRVSNSSGFFWRVFDWLASGCLIKCHLSKQTKAYLPVRDFYLVNIAFLWFGVLRSIIESDLILSQIKFPETEEIFNEPDFRLLLPPGQLKTKIMHEERGGGALI